MEQMLRTLHLLETILPLSIIDWPQVYPAFPSPIIDVVRAQVNFMVNTLRDIDPWPTKQAPAVWDKDRDTDGGDCCS